jgi:secreted trypsin-like serine protease
MKLAIASSVVLAALTALASIGCSEPIGRDDATDSDEIVGGTEAAVGAWPGTVALYSGSQQICGGTLVAKNWVLTAGHCVRPGTPNGGVTKVVIGRHKLSSTDGESIPVKKATRHPGFNSSTLDNDLSLLELEAPSTGKLAKLVAPTSFAALSATEMLTVVGWGTMREGAFSSSDVLRQVDVPIIPSATCKTFSRYDTITENQICAGYPEGGRDSCQGDSGGPIFAKINNETIQVGLVSWGIGCARANAPGVYTKLANYGEWLKTTSAGAVTIGTTTGGGTTFEAFEETGDVARGEMDSFSYDVPAGTYVIDLTGTNDADLYVRKNEAAALSAFDCRPFRNGSNESCTVVFAEAGKLHVSVRGFRSGTSTYTLKGSKKD